MRSLASLECPTSEFEFLSSRSSYVLQPLFLAFSSLPRALDHPPLEGVLLFQFPKLSNLDPGSSLRLLFPSSFEHLGPTSV